MSLDNTATVTAWPNVVVAVSDTAQGAVLAYATSGSIMYAVCVPPPGPRPETFTR